MQPRRKEVAKLAGVTLEQVLLANVVQVRRTLTGKIDPVVLEVATQEPAYYWQVGQDFYLDDAFFGDVVSFSDLGMDRELGLFDRRNFPDL